MTEPMTTPLHLNGADVLLKRVASNFEKHGEQPVPVLDITCEMQLPPAQLQGLLGQYCDRTLFNHNGELLEPADVFKRSELPVPISEDLVAQFVSFTLSDNIEREFGEEPEEGEDAKPSQLCPITNLRYEPKVGGSVWLGFSIRVRPRDALENWAFLEHQGRHAKLTVADSAIKVGNGRQQSLALQGGGREPPPQPGEPANQERRTLTGSNGEEIALRTGEEISDEMRARNPDGETMGAAASGEAAPAGEGAAEFEAGATAKVDEFKRERRKSPHRIDGRRGAH